MAQLPIDSGQLGQLGWDEHFDRQLADLDTGQSRIARVVSMQRGGLAVSDYQDEWLCTIAGRLLHSAEHDYPVTGDWVLVEDTLVTRVIPRRNILSRGEAGSRGARTKGARREQPIAANLDTVFIVCGLDRDFNIRRLERYLTLVFNCGLAPVVVLTKADLHEDPEPFRAEAETIALGTPVVLASKLDERGKEELESYLGTGQTVAMIGSSGAGKSTLANMLAGKNIQATGEVSLSDGKGRHTTTTRELIRMPQGGLLMDNPGIREIAFHEDGSGVEDAFADVAELADSCRFADCRHHHEPDCAVQRAVETGALPAERLESYHKLQNELQFQAERRTKSADRVEKERWRSIALANKRMKKKKK